MRTGWLTAPISGGQSWLAHGTFASGLLTVNQALYTAMLASARKSLFHLASENGYHVATVAPAVQSALARSETAGVRRGL